MTNDDASKLEHTISILSETEKEMDALKARSEAMKRELIAFAREEVARVKESALASISASTEATLDSISTEAKGEASQIQRKGVQEVDRLRILFEKNRVSAVEAVVEALLGE